MLLRHPTPAEMETVNNRLQPFFCRTTKEQLEVPPALPDKVLTCPAAGEENRLLELLVQKYRGNKLALFLRQDILRDFKLGRFQALLTNPHTLGIRVPAQRLPRRHLL